MPHSTVCLSFDFDALSVWFSYDRVSPNMLQRGEYGARVGIPRVLALLHEYQIPATFFIPGHTIDSFPGEVAAIQAAGHELAHHSYNHVAPADLTPDQERADFERAMAALARIGVRPSGYRAPGDHSAQTLLLLEEYGFGYDSSYKGDDYRPYRPRIGDIVDRETPLQRGREAALWELPTSYEFDDWVHFQFNFSPYRNGTSAPSKVLEIWQAELDWMDERIDGGILTVLMHPQIIGRGSRMAMLEAFIQHAQQRQVRFCTMATVVAGLE
ncbi:MAG: polysaccharide deacetylase [Roseiflexaceae bacterium]